MIGWDLDPVIIVTLTTEPTEIFGVKIPAIPLLPIPLYISEGLTEVMGEGAENTIEVKNTTKGDKVYETPSAQDLTIRLQLRKGNTLYSLILAAMKQIYDRIEKSSYFITAYFDSSFMLSGRLKSFSSVPVQDTDLQNVTMVFTYDPEEKPLEKILPGVSKTFSSLWGS